MDNYHHRTRASETSRWTALVNRMLIFVPYIKFKWPNVENRCLNGNKKKYMLLATRPTLAGK